MPLKIKGHPISAGGDLDIPADQRPVVLDGASVLHYTKWGHKPLGSSEFSARFDGATPSIGVKPFPVSLVITNDRIIFHSKFRPKVFGDGHAKMGLGKVYYGWLSTKRGGFHVGVDALRLRQTRNGMCRLDVCSQSDASDTLYTVTSGQDLAQYANEIIARCGGQEFFDNSGVDRTIILNT
ncbi:MAG: hypothetical protein LBG60_02490 [Bifidobacteriaceae bacterium]|jgi:hypothetical protein|nr:hypothetical protein [Bifidobacteriaceae bacterium]